MRGLQPATGLEIGAEDVTPGLPLLPRAEGLAFDILHGDIDAIAVGARVVDPDHVLMREAGERLGLAEQALAVNVTILRRRMDELDRIAALGILVPAEVDIGHAAAADPAQDDVLADPRRLSVAEQPGVDAVDDQPVLDVGGEGLLHDGPVEGNARARGSWGRR